MNLETLFLTWKPQYKLVSKLTITFPNKNAMFSTSKWRFEINVDASNLIIVSNLISFLSNVSKLNILIVCALGWKSGRLWLSDIDSKV